MKAPSFFFLFFGGGEIIFASLSQNCDIPVLDIVK